VLTAEASECVEDGSTFEPFGTHRVRGVDTPVELFVSR
jgi:hypothetical protein